MFGIGSRIPLPIIIRGILILVWVFTGGWWSTNWALFRQVARRWLATAAWLVVLGLTWLIGAVIYLYLHPAKALAARKD